MPNQIPFQEFEERLKTGYYVKDGLRLCKTIQTLVDFMSKFQEHREELLEMFNYKLKELENPTLWIK